MVFFKSLICYRFFTMVPHDFGTNNAPLLNNIEIIKEKTAMLDNLLEIEIAYSLLKSGKLIFLALHLLSTLGILHTEDTFVK